jgi:hypothetical protein
MKTSGSKKFAINFERVDRKTEYTRDVVRRRTFRVLRLAEWIHAQLMTRCRKGRRVERCSRGRSCPMGRVAATLRGSDNNSVNDQIVFLLPHSALRASRGNKRRVSGVWGDVGAGFGRKSRSLPFPIPRGRYAP